MNPETRNMVATKFKTPSPDMYEVPTDNPYFKKKKIAHVTEKKFFEPKNMPSIRARVPIQYTSIDGVTPKGFTERGSKLANYIGGS